MWFLLEHHVWVYPVPFFALPPEKGERIRRLLERNVSHGLAKQFEILAELKRIGGGER